MNFLTLCQRLATESGVSGTLLTTQNQVGSLGRIVNWIGDAWNEIQMLHDDWDWMRASNILGSGASFTPGSGQFNTPLGTAARTLGIAVDSFGKWDESTFRCFTTAQQSGGVSEAASGAIGGMAIGVGHIGVAPGGGIPLDETFLDCIDFDRWRNGYMLGAMRQVTTRPYVIAIGPDQSLNLGPPPNGAYTITGDYWMAPSLLVNDTDVPLGLPTRWHMLIVYRALFKYGYYEAASDVLQRATAEWAPLYRQLENRRLPTVTFGGALA